MAAFFIVFSPQGTSAPAKVHASHKAALGAAHRTAAAHPGQEFFVMRSASKPAMVQPAEPAQQAA